MKRVLVFALVLVFTGASVFALDLGNGLTADVEIKSGLSIATTPDGNDDSEDTRVFPGNDDAGEKFRARLTLGYTGDWGGTKIRFQSLGGNLSPKYAYGWVNLLDSKIVLSGGNIGDHLWGLGKLGANVFDPNLDAVTGVRAEFKLVDGLSFGAAWKVNDVPTDIDKALAAWVFGGLYTSPLFSVAASLGITPGTDEVPARTSITYEWYDHDNNPATAPQWGERPSITPGTPEFDPWIGALVGLEVNPIDVLKVVVDLQFDSRKLEDHGKIGYFRLGPLVQFTQGPLAAHVRADIVVPNEDKGQSSSDYENSGGTVEKYGDTSIAFRVGAGYDITSNINAYAQIGSDNVSYLAGEEGHPGAGLYVKPGITFTFGTSSIGIFDKINGIGAKDNKNGAGDTYSSITNQLQIDFNWVF